MDFNQLKRYSLSNRKSLVSSSNSSSPPKSPALFIDFIEALPDYLKAKDLKELAKHILNAKLNGKPIIFMMGAHAIKVGLSAWIIEAIRRKFITALACNGACLIHDFEIALAGNTSEDVAESLQDGRFGMTLETGQIINQWIIQAAQDDIGLGEGFARAIQQTSYPHKDLSIFAAAKDANLPVTVHVAMGTDVIHHHPEASGEAIGKTSHQDFHRLCDVVSQIANGGVVLNIGSNVIMPEVFLKALTVARNICGPIDYFTTANFDMIQHYRPMANVVKRPVMNGGQGFSFTGHHEIMLPLLFTYLFEND